MVFLWRCGVLLVFLWWFLWCSRGGVFVVFLWCCFCGACGMFLGCTGLLDKTSESTNNSMSGVAKTATVVTRSAAAAQNKKTHQILI